MYANLKMEMNLKGITIEDIAKSLEIHRNSASFKINGKGKFTIDEAFKIHQEYFAYADMQYLFRKNKRRIEAESAKEAEWHNE